MAWALPVHPVLKKVGDVPDDLSTLLALPPRPSNHRGAIDQYAEAALGNREFFLNKPYGIGGSMKDNIP